VDVSRVDTARERDRTLDILVLQMATGQSRRDERPLISEPADERTFLRSAMGRALPQARAWKRTLRRTGEGGELPFPPRPVSQPDPLGLCGERGSSAERLIRAYDDVFRASV
jgi:hypothetical protein